MIYFLIVYCIYIITYGLSCTWCFYKDIDISYNKKRFQPLSRNELVSIYYEALPLVIRNLLIIPIIGVPMMILWEYMDGPTQSFNFYNLPTDLFWSIMILDFTFYCCHRLLHTKTLYSKVHKIHHKFTAPVSIIGIYAHWFEYLIGNILSVFLPPVLLGVNIYSLIIYSIISTIDVAVIAHGGYFDNHHDEHHRLFVGNYGIGIYMDRLFGTMISH